MGGCWSQQSIDNETMLAEHDPCSIAERSAGDEVVVPVPGGSSEYIGAYVENGMVPQNAIEPTLLLSEDQTEQRVLGVSPNVYQNSTEQMFDFSIEKTGSTNVDQPIIYQPFEEQPLVEDTVYEVFEELPQALLVSSNQVEEPRPPVSSNVNYDNQKGNEAVLDAPIETTVKPFVDEPLYQPVEDYPMDERTFNQIIEEQPVVETMHNQIFEEPVDAPSFGEHAVPAQSSEIPASTEVYETIQVEETQPSELDVGVVFEGRTYSTRVFDPHLKEYVYVSGHNVQPRGGLVM